MKRSFKGWTIPGPLPGVAGAAGMSAENVEVADEESLDAISGHFKIFQLKKGHRFSTDDVLVAWYGAHWAPAPRRVLDLGSGIGSVALVAAWCLPQAHFVTLEAQAISIGLAKKSVALNGLEDRFELLEGDLRNETILASQEPFDLVLGSPPYWPLEEGTQAEHPQKVACRFEVRGDVGDYVAAARRNLGPAGVFACVFPIDVESQHERVRAAAKVEDMTILRMRPVIFREGNEPYLGLFLMIRNEDIPEKLHHKTWVEPPLTIRNQNGHVNQEYMAIKMSFGFPP